jgi:hypothetical protein
MAKEIALVENNAKGREIRRYLIKVEEAWNSPEMIMQRAVQLSRRKIKPYSSRSGMPGDASHAIYGYQVKYRYTDKIEKRDMLDIFRYAIGLKHFYDDWAVIRNELIIKAYVAEERLFRMCKRFGINENEIPTRPKSNSKEWPDCPELKAPGSPFLESSADNEGDEFADVTAYMDFMQRR